MVLLRSGIDDGQQLPLVRLRVALVVLARRAYDEAIVALRATRDGSRPTPRQRLRWRRSAQTCGSAAATLTQPLGSTSSVAGGSARLARRPPVHAEGLVAELHAAAAAASRASSARKPPYAAAAGSTLVPVARRGADAHQLAGVEAEGAERARALDDRLGLVQVDARRRERDLERQARRAHRAAGGMRLRERAAGPLALVDLLGVAVEADLDRADRQAGEPSARTRASKRWPLVSILSRTPPAPSASATSKKCGTTSGSPPHSIT